MAAADLGGPGQAPGGRGQHGPDDGSEHVLAAKAAIQYVDSTHVKDGTALMDWVEVQTDRAYRERDLAVDDLVDYHWDTPAFDEYRERGPIDSGDPANDAEMAIRDRMRLEIARTFTQPEHLVETLRAVDFVDPDEEDETEEDVDERAYAGASLVDGVNKEGEIDGHFV